ncbi:MAG TPA: M1 family metallopeptidase [Pyrinomonadaceae bacterium]|nr:M1 family metallopeptidase [Pyrinomonadaceae bacterium]
MKSKVLMRVLVRRALVVALLLAAACAQVAAARRERLVDAWRPVHYAVSVRLDDQLTELTSASAEVSVLVLKGPLGVIDLDFGDLTVDSVTIGGAPARFEQGNGRLNVTLPQPAAANAKLVIVVNYHGKPKDGLILKADKAGKPSATGDNWPDRVHHWIPCLDHPSAKATVEFTVTAPSRDLVVANGRLVKTSTRTDGTTVWIYRESNPIPPYCMIIAVGEFAKVDSPARTAVPLIYYVPQTDRDQAVQGFSAGPPSLQYFSELVAPFPYEKLALIVGATRFGGMENSGAIVFASNLLDTRYGSQPLSPTFKIRRGLVEVTAHEIAHQWFGDSVAIKTWADLWLSEGFATYFEGVFVERYDGKEAFREYMRRTADSYLKSVQLHRTPIYDTETEDLFKLLNANNYQKGGWVLHMLRGTLGDEAFFKGIRAYYRAHAHGNASTEDLRAALEKSSGKNLKEFFARWVYAAGHPRYEASWSWQAARGGRGELVIRLRQTQEDAPFLDPLAVEIVTARGTQRATLRPAGKETLLRVPLPRQPSDVRIDPDNMILKELVVKKADAPAAPAGL